MGARNAVRRLGEWQERRLLRRLACGDQDARRRLIEAHLSMVSALGQRYARRWDLPLEDILQEGAIALVQAVDHYDPNRGMKLSTYATWWVKQAMKRAALAQSLPVRIPERLWEQAAELSRAEQHRLGYRPDQDGEALLPSEASSRMDEELEEVRCALRPVVSLESQLGESANTLKELLPDNSAEDPEVVVASSDARYWLAQALASLPDRERTVLSGRTGFEDGHSQSLTSIGKGLGISRERVRQLEDKALKELREQQRELRLEGLAA